MHTHRKVTKQTNDTVLSVMLKEQQGSRPFGEKQVYYEDVLLQQYAAATVGIEVTEKLFSRG